MTKASCLGGWTPTRFPPRQLSLLQLVVGYVELGRMKRFTVGPLRSPHGLLLFLFSRFSQARGSFQVLGASRLLLSPPSVDLTLPGVALTHNRLNTLHEVFHGVCLHPKFLQPEVDPVIGFECVRYREEDIALTVLLVDGRHLPFPVGHATQEFRRPAKGMEHEIDAEIRFNVFLSLYIQPLVVLFRFFISGRSCCVTTKIGHFSL